jgi:hypothetical protein
VQDLHLSMSALAILCSLRVATRITSGLPALHPEAYCSGNVMTALPQITQLLT